MCGNRSKIPVSGRGIVILGRYPAESVQVFPADITIEAGEILIQLFGLHRGLVKDILFDLLLGVSVFQHQFDGIGGDLQRGHSLGQIVFHIGRGGDGFVLSGIVDGRDRCAVIDDGIIDGCKDHQEQGHADRKDEVESVSFFTRGKCLRFHTQFILLCDHIDHGQDHQDQKDRDQKQDQRDDIVYAGTVHILRKQFFHPACQIVAAETAADGDAGDDHLQQELGTGFGRIVFHGVDAFRTVIFCGSPSEEKNDQVAGKCKIVIRIFQVAFPIVAGSGPHTVLCHQIKEDETVQIGEMHFFVGIFSVFEPV